jgi:hypothetical protein
MLFDAAGPFGARCTTTQKDQARGKPGLVKINLTTCNQNNDFYSLAYSSRRKHTDTVRG